MNKKLLLVGGGGHCKSIIDSLLKINQYSEIGIIDKKQNIGKDILDTPIIGSDNDLLRLSQQGYNFAFVSLGSVGDSSLRIKLFNLLDELGFKIPNIIDETANVSDYVNMERGIYIGKNAIINAGTSIGKGVIINTGAIIEHDCVIKEFSHIAPGSVLCGEVQIGANSHIGAKSVVKQQVKVGMNTMIGMGSVVIRDLGDNVLAYGNPCKGGY